MSLSTVHTLSDKGRSNHSSTGDIFPPIPGPSTLPDEPHRHFPRLTRSITNSSFRSTRTHTGFAATGQGISEDQYRLLLELQRLLYHGPGEKTYLDDDEEDGVRDGDGRKEQLRAFVHEYLEADCLYESPLITLHSRQLFLDATALATDLAKGSLPSLWPRAVATHIKSAVRWGFGKIFTLSETARAVEKDPEFGNIDAVEQVAKKLALGDQLKMAVVPMIDYQERKDAWWDAWEIGSECSEIGGFETYDGYHLGVIDHTMTLDLLPSILPPTAETEGHMLMSSAITSPNASVSHSHSLLPPLFAALQTKTHRPAPQTSLPLAAVQTLLSSVLRYRLRIRTFVEFNEAGKVSYIRDVVDLRDAWEAIVPFGRAMGWVGRRVGGVMLAGVGGVVSSPTETRPPVQKSKGKGKGLYASHLALQDQLGQRDVFAHMGQVHHVRPSLNALGLQETWPPHASAPPSAELLTAPDVDDGVQATSH